MRTKFREVDDLVHRNQAVELVDDLFNHMRRSRRDDRDTADRLILRDIRDGQTLDIIASRREHAGDAGQDAGLVTDEARERVALRCFGLPTPQYSPFASSSIPPETSLACRIISSCPAPQ